MRLADVHKLIPSSSQVITTRTYDDRLDTISHVRDAGISVCSGGILGLGESDGDRVGLIWEASKYVPCSLFVVRHILLLDIHSMPEHPESFPVNALVPIKGTPLENNEVGIPSIVCGAGLNCSQPVSHHVLLRTIATARIVLPTTIIRLAAGRQGLSENEQAMCFMAGANAVFTGDQMLTTPCKLTRI